MIKKYLVFFLLILSSSLFAKPKYAIGLFHYNFQYVAGDYRIESRIVKESLFPALQFFEKHPQYKVDFEFQGYAIETMAQEYPEVLELLRKLIERGQIELVIAHYSDQFFIAYPALDLQKSIELSDEILEKNNLRRSRVFFGQEIQYSPGLAYALKGKYDVVVTSSDPHSYYRDRTMPLVNVNYGDNSILGLIGAGDKNLKNFEWAWSFLDDGEVFNTLDYNSDFYRVPEQEKKSIDHFKKLEEEGFEFVTMSELVEIIKNDSDYEIIDYPFIPEGTWNMNVCGPFMWMGRQRSGVETDGITRALSYELRGEILVAEKLIEYAKSLGNDVIKLFELLKEAWEHLLLSEVSDSSGWTPWLVEVQYTENEVANARMILDKIFKELNKILLSNDKYFEVNTKTGKVNIIDEYEKNNYSDDYLPIPIFIRAKDFNVEVKKISENTHKVNIFCTRPDDGAVEIAFETSDKIYYSAGTGEETIAEVPTDLKHDPAMTLSNGFLSLGNEYSIIKDCSVEHLAVTWRQNEKRAVFREELNKNNPSMKMTFYVVKGDKEYAHKLANKINTWPVFKIANVNNQITFEKIFPLNK
ncbi:MAG: hypothetical protein H6611_03440 [Ignavibacteriales bacterium]|nr:hypothetical protein [Ignavibacteriales bacterium]